MLKVENLNFSYGNARVLDNISISCALGETVAILGRSGSGKSTLLNLIAGTLQVPTGLILVKGSSPRDAARKGNIGYIFQSPTLLPWRTVRENVEVALQITRGSRETLTPSVDAALAIAHISHAAHQLPHELSGGMQTRASIARALSYGPSLLLADEPFSNLDDFVKESLYAEFQSTISSTQMSTVLVTHSLNEALLLADRIYVLGTHGPNGPSTVVHCEIVPLPRPRGSELFGEEAFLAIRMRLMTALR